MNRAEAKKIARKQLSNNWGPALLVELIVILVTSISSLTGILMLLFSSCLLIGYNSYYIDLIFNRNSNIEDLVDGFKENIGDKIALSILKNIFIVLWSLLFFIPGIVKTYSYSLAELISYNNPNKTYKECLDESRHLMDGHKWEMFVFDLSFIGWGILCIFTFGIGYLFLQPYMTSSKLVFIDKNIYKLNKNIIDVE